MSVSDSPGPEADSPRVRPENIWPMSRPIVARRSARIGGLAMAFLTLGCGYLLSYVFRTITGPMADDLIRRFSLDARSLGLLSSVYFLAFAVSAIPIGIALDAFGPRVVQGCLMSLAALGSLIFALAPDPTALFIGRGLIGMGVAGCLMAGLKAHALWIPKPFLPLANGVLMMFGGLGAILATLPLGLIDSLVGWRGTFLFLAIASAVIACLVFALVPRHHSDRGSLSDRNALKGFLDAVRNPWFIRIAPLSASVVGTSFAIHGLWAARWFTDVERLGPARVLDGLLAMGVGLTFGSLFIGAASVFLSRQGVSATKTFGWFCAAFIALQVAIQLRLAVPRPLLWGAVGAFSGMGVLSYSILDGVFAASVVGRANSALNVVHLATAWAVQAGMGFEIAYWARGQHGHYPMIAYRIAFAIPIAIQVGALVWFALIRTSRDSGKVVSILDDQAADGEWCAVLRPAPAVSFGEPPDR